MVKNLKEQRLKKGLSQHQLGEIIGLSQQSIHKYETQLIEPDISTLIKLADYFDTTVDYLIGRDKQEEQSVKEDINTEEASLIKSFRHLTKEEKESIIFVINNYLAKK